MAQRKVLCLKACLTTQGAVTTPQLEVPGQRGVEESPGLGSGPHSASGSVQADQGLPSEPISSPLAWAIWKNPVAPSATLSLTQDPTSPRKVCSPCTATSLEPESSSQRGQHVPFRVSN